MGCFEYRDGRDRDLLSAYKRQLSHAQPPFMLTDILVKTVQSPAQRFWVSPERALEMIHAINGGDDLRKMLPNKRLMFCEIHRRVTSMRRQPRFSNMSLPTLVLQVVEQPAPCFYLTPGSAMVILHYIRKRMRKQRAKKR